MRQNWNATSPASACNKQAFLHFSDVNINKKRITRWRMSGGTDFRSCAISLTWSRKAWPAWRRKPAMLWYTSSTRPATRASAVQWKPWSTHPEVSSHCQFCPLYDQNVCLEFRLNMFLDSSSAHIVSKAVFTFPHISEVWTFEQIILQRKSRDMIQN